jgi:addiction module HigA family antidote
VAIRIRPAEVFHPGEYINDERIARGWTVEQLAVECGFTTEYTQRIIDGKVTVKTLSANMLARAFGTSARLWLNLQAAWDEWVKVVPQ